MSAFNTFLKSGHSPTLFAAFLYFAFSCAIWVLNGAMAPFIEEAYGLTAAQQGLMLSIPILAGAIMRFPLGVLAQYIGRKKATLVEMGMICVAMLFGLFFVHSFNDLLRRREAVGLLDEGRHGAVQHPDRAGKGEVKERREQRGRMAGLQESVKSAHRVSGPGRDHTAAPLKGFGTGQHTSSCAWPAVRCTARVRRHTRWPGRCRNRASGARCALHYPCRLLCPDPK